mmetsp:Transcript_23036/g.22405  ORF Transcript_23036/g.22405 Transcript_23036/m.22405 type:complete len:243 (+) Transcript_23036:1991-2719(+)
MDILFRMMRLVSLVVDLLGSRHVHSGHDGGGRAIGKVLLRKVGCEGLVHNGLSSLMVEVHISLLAILKMFHYRERLELLLETIKDLVNHWLHFVAMLHLLGVLLWRGLVLPLVVEVVLLRSPINLGRPHHLLLRIGRESQRRPIVKRDDLVLLGDVYFGREVGAVALSLLQRVVALLLPLVAVVVLPLHLLQLPPNVNLNSFHQLFGVFCGQAVAENDVRGGFVISDPNLHRVPIELHVQRE